MGAPLRPAAIDVPLAVLDQVPPDTAGPIGRLKSLKNCQITKYLPAIATPGVATGARTRLEQREAFRTLPTEIRSSVDGSIVTPPWSSPELIESIGGQTLAVCDSIPRVLNGSTWTGYPNNRVITNELIQSVFHTSQRTIQASDSAWLGGVTCSVWTETKENSTGALTSTWVGFRADNKSWLVAPAQLYASITTAFVTSAKVISDGVHFWVFHSTNANGIVVGVYDTHGVLLNTFFNIAPPLHQLIPGSWDVTAVPSTGGYTVLAAVLTDGTSNAGVTLTALKIAGSTVTPNVTTPAVNADFHIAFLTNDSGNGRAYLAVVMTGSPAVFYGYEITNQAITHTYTTGVAVSNGVVDSLAGYVIGTSVFSIVISYTQLATDAAASGPPHDPQRRLTAVFATSSTDTTVQLKSTHSLAQVSRAFKIDDDYYSVCYYQSGSGLSVVPTKETVSVTGGDLMIGAATQPITIQPGDGTEGSPLTLASVSFLAGPQVYTSTGHAAVNVLSGDTVALTNISGASGFGIADGTPVLRWTFAGLAASSAYAGSRMIISGSSNGAANYTWDILAPSSDGLHFYTPLTDVSQTSNGPIGTFSTAGTVTLLSMTQYEVNDISAIVTDPRTYFGGTLVVTGAAHSGNNGTFSPLRFYLGSGPNYIGGAGVTGWSGVWVASTTQSSHADTFSAVLSGDVPNSWTFRSEVFDSSYVGADLIISANPALSGNVGAFPITTVVNANLIETSGTWLPQAFTLPYPTASIQLTTQSAYTFKFQALTLDYTFQGALVSIQGAAVAANNGIYKITQINADGTFVALPQNGLSNQVNEAFTNTQTVTIFFSQAIVPPFQSTWFLMPLTAPQAVAGRWEYGLAYADWRNEDDPTLGPSLFPCAVTTPCLTPAGWQILLPFRAQNVTAAVTEATTAGQVSIVDEQLESTAGLKLFTVENTHGRAGAIGNELLLPGAMATVFSASGFFEDGINVAPEAPYLVSQSTASAGQIGITVGSIREYIVVFEYTDESGNRIYSPPSPALQVNLSGTNNIATIAGRTAFPLDSTGAPIANTYGPTLRNVTISVYATAWINGQQTTQHYKITNDLNVNGIAPYSTSNPSGFSFPDSFTWQFKDQSLDGAIGANEILYTDKAFLPRRPAPAFVDAASWKNREWVIGYDGAVWMSGEKTEGDAVWFSNAFRFTFGTGSPMGMAPMDDYMIVFCDDQSVWYIPAAIFPDATGANGTLPAPVRLPFPNGSTGGYVAATRAGVLYDSTAGGLWLITRSLTNEWLSQPIQDSLGLSAITGIAVDKKQRVAISTGGTSIFVWDTVPGAWYEWVLPSAAAQLGTSGLGLIVYADGSRIVQHAPGLYGDNLGGADIAVPPSWTLAPLHLMGSVRGYGRCWAFQLQGEYKGPHYMNLTLGYGDESDYQAPTVFPAFPVSPTLSYLYEWNPREEEASQFELSFAVTFDAGVAGNSATWELLAFDVGVDTGLARLPGNKRVTYR